MAGGRMELTMELSMELKGGTEDGWWRIGVLAGWRTWGEGGTTTNGPGWRNWKELNDDTMGNG
jgi:hypothetical protein